MARSERGRLRRKTERKRKKVCLIVCEGEETERAYFKKFNRRGMDFSLKVPDTQSRSDVLDLISYAVGYCRHNDIRIKDGDRVFIVFDRDSHSDDHLQKAVRLASENGFELIFSNPCFELWYAFHYKMIDHPIEYAQLESLLSRQLGEEYKKTKCFYEALLERQEVAIKNAECKYPLYAENDLNHIKISSNPATSIHILVKILIGGEL